MDVKKNSKNKVMINDTKCPNCKIDLETHTKYQILKCLQNELLKLNSLNSETNLKSSDETLTGGYIL